MEEKTPKQKVVDILNEYYGEERVDPQADSIILIYFPNVTITNEHDRSINITELYVKIVVNDSGILSGYFLLNRSEYTVEQWCDNYMHSHINSIPRSDLTEFKTPCLGSGPIRNTCATLNYKFDEDLWRLFAFELDKYVHTESLSGIPYHYLEQIGASTGKFNTYPMSIHYRHWLFPNELIQYSFTIKNFIPYLIKNRPFSFSYDNGYYHIADSIYNIIVKVSNLFIEWYNKYSKVFSTFTKDNLLENKVFIVCKTRDEKIYERTSSANNALQCKRMIGSPLWRFKGKLITLNITGLDNRDLEMDENVSILLNPTIVMYIVSRIIRTINYLYGSEERARNNQNALKL